jgi:hypothetical protein
VLCCCLILAPVAAFSQIEASNPCGSLVNPHGPYDYRVYKDRPELQIVDKYHFTPLVENLIKPMFQHFAADIDYALRASPNHHRALVTLTRLSLKLKNPRPPGAGRDIECYFERGIRYAPDDMVVRMLYVDYLIKLGGRHKDLMQQLDYVSEHAGDNPFTHYNLGLLFFDAKEYAKSLRHAQVAWGLGFKHTVLKDKLVAAGKWAERSPPGAAPALPAASAADAGVAADGR